MEYSKEVLFNGKSQDVIWKSDIKIIGTDTKIFSRRDCDIVILQKGSFIGIYDDNEPFYLISEEKKGFLGTLFGKDPILDDCEIYYINRQKQLENKWGTASRIDFYDKEYDIHTSVGGNGSYRFSINNSNKLMSKILGSDESLSQEMVREFFKSELNMHIRNSIAQIFQSGNYSLKDTAYIVALEKEVSEKMNDVLMPLFDEYGVKLEKFFVSEIVFDKEFLDQMRHVKKDAILKKVVRDSEEDIREEEKEKIKLMAETQAMVNASESKSEIHQHIYENVKYCSECGKKLPPNAKFCSECGTKVV